MKVEIEDSAVAKGRIGDLVKGVFFELEGRAWQATDYLRDTKEERLCVRIDDGCTYYFAYSIVVPVLVCEGGVMFKKVPA